MSLPFWCVSLEGALRAAGERYDVVAATLGAGPMDDVPAGHPAAGAARACWPGAVLAFARSLGEFGATITFAGNFPGTTQTMPSLHLHRAAGRPRGGGR